MKTTKYFDRVQPVKHPEVSHEVAFWVADNYEYEHVQDDGRLRRWAYVEELEHWVRVIVESDEETLHNAFIDSGFKPER